MNKNFCILIFSAAFLVSCAKENSNTFFNPFPLKLTSISKKGSSYKAKINGKTVKKGDFIKGYEVLEVNGTAVKLSSLSVLDLKFELQFKPEMARYTSYKKPTAFLKIPLNPLTELDNKTIPEIYELRKKYVSLFSGLLKTAYEPLKVVFDGISGGRPWMGIEGLLTKSKDMKLSDGDSVESLRIVNPFLLADIGTGNIFAEKKSPEYTILPPLPKGLWWSVDGLFAFAEYDITEYLRQSHSKLTFTPGYDLGFYINAINARDLGLEYVFIDYPNCDNINIMRPYYAQQYNAMRTAFYYYYKDDSNYKGGLNSICRIQEEFFFQISYFPAKIQLLFWREKPATRFQKPDMVYVIKIY